MPEIGRRLEGFTESIIRKMTRVCNQHGAVNLSQGFPDFDPPQELLDSLKETASKGPHQYEVTWGSAEFRRLLAEKQKHFMGIDIDPDTEIVVTCGSTEAMMAAIMTACNPGDKVIVFSPFYENYTADSILCEVEPIYVPLRPPSFYFDREELREAFKSGAKALILCNPNNPTGKVFSYEELNYIARLAAEYDAFVITDEVYEHIIYSPHKHTYFASLPDMFERTISCSSLSKTYSITGWRLGYIIGPRKVIDGAKKVHDFLTVGAAAPLQKAALAGLALPHSYYDQLQSQYESKRALFLSGLDELGFRYYRPQGAYYVMVDISEYGITNDVSFCYWMARDIGVGAVPGSRFFREPVHNYIRLHFAKKEETLLEALKRLKNLRELPEVYAI